MTKIRRSQIPGMRFDPSDLQLVNILGRRIYNNKLSRYVTDIHNLYEQEPWLLHHVRHVKFKENEWFYFVTRKQHPGTKKTDSKRPSRKVAGSGRWKTTGSLTHIEKEGVEVGTMQHITFKANSEAEEEDEITTGWVMHEYVLNKPGFQEVVLCRIRFYPGEDNAQYAPRLEPIMIGLEREDGLENNLQNHMIGINNGVADAAFEDIQQYLDVPVETIDYDH
ncbi:hypothetical protein EUTSA_v10029188mg [Eutrema salsugineum]|uniref:NAC domain-containing protein n=1 Tax=Eutrema salsugineum TaxID=72664 RepID=V4L689_EUTSA|nr:NAC domain-containing protein 40 [Eutrema salsugineum]ESQ37822.1 hypothetical protein EUTSA_v10029188mg [Eutrema salsugineum]